MIKETRFAKLPEINKVRKEFLALTSIEQVRKEFLALTSDSQLCSDQLNTLPGLPYQLLPFGLAISEENWVNFLKGVSQIPGFIGIGRERTVSRIKGQPNIALSVFHEPKDWYYLLESFRLNRVLKLLFPHNFPQIRGYFGYNDQYIKGGLPAGFYHSGFWSELVEGIVPITDSLAEGFSGLVWDEENFNLGYEEGSDEVKFPFQDVLLTCTSLGLSLRNLGFDPHRNNFLLGSDGGEYYADTLHGPYHAGREFFHNWDAAKTMYQIRRQFTLTPVQEDLIRYDIGVISGQEV